MSDAAEMRGPVTRRRRITVSGNGGGAAAAKRTNGNKCHGAGEKAPGRPAAAKANVGASNGGKAGGETGASGQKHHPDSPKKQRSVVEDLNHRLR